MFNFFRSRGLVATLKVAVENDYYAQERLERAQKGGFSSDVVDARYREVGKRSQEFLDAYEELVAVVGYGNAARTLGRIVKRFHRFGL